MTPDAWDPPDMDAALGRAHVVAPPPHPLHDKWCAWIKDISDRISHEIFFNRFTFRGLQRIIAEHGALPGSHVFEYFGSTYVRSQAVAVRAEIDVRDDVATLGRLLVDLIEHPEVMTRERYVAHWPAGAQNLGDGEFDQDFAGAIGMHLDPDIVRSDLGGLRTGATHLVRQYVNKAIAHNGLHGPATIPTFDDLDDAIDNLGALLQRYDRLLTGSGLGLVEPVVTYDWEAPFREPWIRPNA